MYKIFPNLHPTMQSTRWLCIDAQHIRSSPEPALKLGALESSQYVFLFLFKTKLLQLQVFRIIDFFIN